MFETRNDCCPVQIFRTYLVKCPGDLRTSGPFYLAIIYNPVCTIGLKDLGWVSNTISNMENIISKSSLEKLKHITNHSAQKSGKKIKTKYVLKSEIISLTGHRAEAGFDQKISKINLFFTFKAINFDRRSPIFYIAL